MKKYLAILLIPIVFLAQTAFAAIALVTKAGATAAGTPSFLDLPAMNVAAGNFIIGAGTALGHHITGVTDTAGNTYFLLSRISGAATPSEIDGFYAKNTIANSSNVIRLTYDSTANGINGVAIQYSGVDTTNPLDQFASGFNDSPFNTQATAAFTTTSANEGIFSAISLDNPRSYSAGGTQDATTPMTLRIGSGGDATASSALWAADNIVSSIQTGITAGYTGIDRFNIFAQTFVQASAAVATAVIPQLSVQNGGIVVMNGGIITQ